jgi:flagellar motor switch protein FliN/FliY
MQLYPISFAKDMCEGVSRNMEIDTNSVKEEVPDSTPAPTPASMPEQNAELNQQAAGQPMMGQQMMGQQMMGQTMMNSQMMGQPVNVQPAQFQPFNGGMVGAFQPENIDLIMDVPLEVTVELGRTQKSISDILDFSPGKIIELNKIAGEPIDILVNGKYVAKGEVVVIEESFGVRITEIVGNTVKY